MTSNLKTSQPRRAKRSHILIVALLFLLQWLFLFNPRQGVWDAAFYYAFTRSVVFDHDLDLINDIVLSYPEAPQAFIDKGFDAGLTVTGRVDSAFAIGSSLLWIPWMTVIYGGYQVLSVLNPVDVLGYEWLFVEGTAIFSALLAWVAFWLAYKLLIQEINAKIALFAIITLMFTTPLIYYQFREPLYSHASSAFSISLVIYAWWRTHATFRPESLGRAFLLGGLIGFAALVRWQHMVYLILPGLTAVLWWLNQSEKFTKKVWLPAVHYGIAVGFATGAVFSIQMAIWRLFYGSWVTVPQGAAYVDWSAPFLWPTLFSTYRGVLPWLPILFLAVVGLLTKVRKRPFLIIPLLAVLLLELYINSSTRDWFGGGGFGPRRYTSELAIIALGYAFLLQLIPRRIRSISSFVLGSVLAIHQLILLRFGVPDKIGGHHLSMYPTYKWVDVGFREFWHSLVQRLPELWQRPGDVFIYAGSPMDVWVHQSTFPIQQILALMLTLLFLYAVQKVVCFIVKWEREMAVSQRILLLIGTLLIITINIWILNWA